METSQHGARQVFFDKLRSVLANIDCNDMLRLIMTDINIIENYKNEIKRGRCALNISLPVWNFSSHINNTTNSHGNLETRSP